MAGKRQAKRRNPLGLLIIERKGAGLQWEAYAFPGNDVVQALQDLKELRTTEKESRYRGKFRLVRQSLEIIDTD